jgi:hypothetical protein
MLLHANTSILFDASRHARDTLVYETDANDMASHRRTLSLMTHESDHALLNRMSADDVRQLVEHASAHAPVFEQFNGQGWCALLGEASSRTQCRSLWNDIMMVASMVICIAALVGTLRCSTTVRKLHRTVTAGWLACAKAAPSITSSSGVTRRMRRKRRATMRSKENGTFQQHAEETSASATEALSPTSTTATTTSDDSHRNSVVRGAKIIQQLHHYFEVQHLHVDTHLRSLMDDDGFVSIDTVCAFPRMMALHATSTEVIELLDDSPVVDIDPQRNTIRSRQWRCVIAKTRGNVGQKD